MLEIISCEKYPVFKITGEVDNNEGDVLKQKILEIVAGNQTPRFIVDISGIKLLPSSILSVLVSAHRKVVESGGKMVICSVQEPLRKMFDVTRLNYVFEIASDIPSAIKRLE